MVQHTKIYGSKDSDHATAPLPIKTIDNGDGTGSLSISISNSASSSTSGTTTAAYVAALTWSCLLISKKLIIITNTHATLTMKYRIRGYAYGSTYYIELFPETTLAASTSQPLIIPDTVPFNSITVEVIDGSGHATYAVDYCGGA